MRARATASVIALAALLGAGAAPTRDDSTPDPYTILARVKAGLRAQQRPPYVVYTIARRDTVDGVPDFADTYRLRVWCRTADDAALSRVVFGSRTVGDANFIRPQFDRPIDPGPPTADLLDVLGQSPPSAPPAMPGVAVIGAVSAYVETNYHVTYAGLDHGDVHVKLEARRDPDRNRLTDLYVDGSSLELHRAVAHDHLYEQWPARAIPERFEIEFGAVDGVPVIVAIHGQTDVGALEPRDSEPFRETDYRFEEIAFPTELPDWYFDPQSYGAHRAEFPR
jgi:hypothetical protein